MNVIELTKKLISIPSYVDGEANESEIGQYLDSFISKNFKGLKVSRQVLTKNSERFNLICGKKKTTLMVIGHIDTVQIQKGWATDPLKATVKKGDLYGLGAADMKGSIAAFLVALLAVKNKIDLSKLSLLLYCDEEYDFLGMKKFVKEVPDCMSPKMVLSLDGASFAIESGCRGCIELNFAVTGKTAHSSKPFRGINAITQAVAAYGDLSRFLEIYEDKYLGPTTTNLAYIQGATVSTKDGKPTWRRAGNIIPDYVDVTIEVRPAVRKVTKAFVIKKFRAFAEAKGLKVEKCATRLSTKPWPVAYDSLECDTISRLSAGVGVPLAKGNRMFAAYYDIAMMSEKIDVPMFVIGTGGQNQHSANESVTVESLEKATKVYKAILKEYCPK